MIFQPDAGFKRPEAADIRSTLGPIQKNFPDDKAIVKIATHRHVVPKLGMLREGRKERRY